MLIPRGVKTLPGLIYMAALSPALAYTNVQMPESNRLPPPAQSDGIAMGGSVSVCAGRCAVGAEGYQFGIGAVFVYQWTGTNYVRQALLQPAGLSANDRFGYSVAIQQDVLAAGTYILNEPGLAYVFQRAGTNWIQRARLSATPVPAGEDDFGSSVSLSGNTLAVGARGENNRRGATYVFIRQGTNWVQQARLTPDAVPNNAAEFGESVCLDGSNLVVGASWQGRAYVFNRRGTNWVKQAVLTPPDRGGYYGASVSMQGNTLAVGDRLGTNRAGILCGSVFVYVRLQTNWTYQFQANPSDAASGQNFGTGVSVFGNQILVGAMRANTPASPTAGAAYLLYHNGQVWSEGPKFSRASGSETNDYFAYAVSMWGSHLVIGGTGDDYQGLPNVGAAFATDWRIAPAGNFFATDRADLALIDRNRSDWYLYSPFYNGGVGPGNFGWDQTEPVPGDYDGDGAGDLAVFHRARGDWYLSRSSLGITGPINFGWAETEPVPADYDGDGVTDLAVYHRARGDWYIWRSTLGITGPINFGWAETEPVPKDYDGDGRADLAVFHRARGDWYLLRSSLGFTGPINFGWAEVTPVPADYDGDRRADLAVYHQARGDWYLNRTRGGFLGPFNFGYAGAAPVPRDYDGDGRADMSVYETAPANWTWISTASNRYVGPVHFGNGQLQPVQP